METERTGVILAGCCSTRRAGRLDEVLDFGDAQRLRQGAFALGPDNANAGFSSSTAFCDEIFQELADGGEAAGAGGGAEAILGLVCAGRR